VVVAALLGSVPLGPWLIRERAIVRPDAILVLGSHEFERLPYAATLAARWPDAAVLLTQPVAVTPYNCQDCANRARTLASAGVAPARVHVLTPPVRNTFDELSAAAGWLDVRGARRLLVVTSPYHTRRASGLAAAVMPGATVGVVGCPVAGGLARPWWSRRYDRRYVVYELAALLNNSWRHGIPPRLWLVVWMHPRV
jgi:uncharacterized SAM-binding protein YcdF (DUF218 family)